MITSLTIKEGFEQGFDPDDTAKAAIKTRSYPIPSLPVGCILDTSSHMVIIIGDNGTGKTTLLKKLSFQLGYGRLQSFKENPDMFYHITGCSCPDVYTFSRREIDFPDFWHSEGEELDKKNALLRLSQGQYGLHSIREFLDEAREIEHKPSLIFDQPEDGISMRNRQVLVNDLKTFAYTEKRQLFIATHEPLFTKVEGARVINLDDRPATSVKSEDFK